MAAGLVLNVAAFCLAALCLHRLSLRVLGGSSKAGSSWGSGMGPTMSHIEGSFRRRSARLRSMGAEPCVSRMPGDVAEAEQQRGHDNSRQLQSVRLRGRSPEEEREQRQGERAADMALIFFCCNPASVFYSAAYSEALFAAATWAGLLLLPRRHWAGVAALAAASALRSNGILGVWFPLHKALAAAATQGGLPLREAGRAALSCAAVLTPYVAMQGERRRCGGNAEGRPAGMGFVLLVPQAARNRLPTLARSHCPAAARPARLPCSLQPGVTWPTAARRRHIPRRPGAPPACPACMPSSNESTGMSACCGSTETPGG